MELRGGNVVIQPAYQSLSSQLAMVHPSSTEMAQYSPTKTAATVCPSSTLEVIDWDDPSLAKLDVSLKIPPIPNVRLCSCMMQSLGCVAVINKTASAGFFSRTDFKGCDGDLCAGAEGNTTLGKYGAYSVCNATERSSWAYDQLYIAQGRNLGACNSLGGIIHQPTPSASQAADCQAYLRQAGPAGTGVITFVPHGNSTQHTAPTPLRATAKAGIAVGAILAAIVIVSLIYFFRRFQKKKRAHLHLQILSTSTNYRTTRPNRRLRDHQGKC